MWASAGGLEVSSSLSRSPPPSLPPSLLLAPFSFVLLNCCKFGFDDVVVTTDVSHLKVYELQSKYQRLTMEKDAIVTLHKPRLRLLQGVIRDTGVHSGREEEF